MKTRYLFLDIDGVLNNSASMGLKNPCDFHVRIAYGQPVEREHLNFDEQCVQLIRQLFETYFTDVVIVSMWRYDAEKIDFRNLFKLYGLDIPEENIHFIDQTVYDDGQGIRSQLIETFIKANKVERFVIIDDTPEHYDRLHDRLVLTNMNEGFTKIDFNSCVELLSED